MQQNSITKLQEVNIGDITFLITAPFKISVYKFDKECEDILTKFSTNFRSTISALEDKFTRDEICRLEMIQFDIFKDKIFTIVRFTKYYGFDDLDLLREACRITKCNYAVNCFQAQSHN